MRLKGDSAGGALGCSCATGKRARTP